ncbi:hypothetical protein PsYK624_052780 [Phanerochaete sordida]|uniref:Uncharacterized protein n=1 Tax=Phanerochaete sordida TaxID=48140 RepID=A0A9P3G6I8_9APHY|nr:hypothetical protein PsYK624_052780 [Phanerochaete sordida]
MTQLTQRSVAVFALQSHPLLTLSEREVKGSSLTPFRRHDLVAGSARLARRDMQYTCLCAEIIHVTSPRGSVSSGP